MSEIIGYPFQNYDPSDIALCSESRFWYDNGFSLMRVKSSHDYQPRQADIINGARRVHAEGYLEQGLATQNAITKEQVLSREIDKSGGKEGIIYYLAQHIDQPEDKATGRLIPAHSLGNLATYGLVQQVISHEGLKDLKDIINPASPYNLYELGALAKSRFAHENRRQEGSITIIRSVLRDTVGRDTFLYCSMVQEARNGLAGVITAENLNTIGDPVVLEANKYRRETTLVPVLIDPNDFVRNIYSKYLVAIRMSKERPEEKQYAKQASAMLRSMIFFAEDLNDEFVPSEVREIERFLHKKQHESEEKTAS